MTFTSRPVKAIQSIKNLYRTLAKVLLTTYLLPTKPRIAPGLTTLLLKLLPFGSLLVTSTIKESKLNVKYFFTKVTTITVMSGVRLKLVFRLSVFSLTFIIKRQIDYERLRRVSACHQALYLCLRFATYK